MQKIISNETERHFGVLPKYSSILTSEEMTGHQPP